MAVFKWCFIGTGKLAYQVAKEIIRSGRHEIVSVYTRRPEKGKAFAKKFGGTAHADAKQAEELFALARSKGIYVAEAMWTWFSPVAVQVKQWMEEGECGEIRKVVTHYHLNVHVGLLSNSQFSFLFLM